MKFNNLVYKTTFSFDESTSRNQLYYYVNINILLNNKIKPVLSREMKFIK